MECSTAGQIKPARPVGGATLGGIPEPFQAHLTRVANQRIGPEPVTNIEASALSVRKRRGELGFADAGETLDEGPGGAATSPSHRVQRSARDFALERALSRLPEHCRRVIHWHHHDGLSFESIGLRLRISADEARRLWARGLVRLKRDLGPDHDPR